MDETWRKIDDWTGRSPHAISRRRLFAALDDAPFPLFFLSLLRFVSRARDSWPSFDSERIAAHATWSDADVILGSPRATAATFKKVSVPIVTGARSVGRPASDDDAMSNEKFDYQISNVEE